MIDGDDASAEVAELARRELVGVAVGFELAIFKVKEPVVGDLGLGVEGEFDVAIVVEGRFGDFDDDKGFCFCGVAVGVVVVLVLDDGKVGFGFAVEGEGDGGLAAEGGLVTDDFWEDA